MAWPKLHRSQKQKQIFCYLDRLILRLSQAGIRVKPCTFRWVVRGWIQNAAFSDRDSDRVSHRWTPRTARRGQRMKSRTPRQHEGTLHQRVRQPLNVYFVFLFLNEEALIVCLTLHGLHLSGSMAFHQRLPFSMSNNTSLFQKWVCFTVGDSFWKSLEDELWGGTRNDEGHMKRALQKCSSSFVLLIYHICKKTAQCCSNWFVKHHLGLVTK